MSDQRKTGWIHNLKKGQIIEELRKRNIQCLEEEKFEEIRERLRRAIKEAPVVKENKSSTLQQEENKSKESKEFVEPAVISNE